MRWPAASAQAQCGCWRAEAAFAGCLSGRAGRTIATCLRRKGARSRRNGPRRKGAGRNERHHNEAGGALCAASFACQPCQRIAGYGCVLRWYGRIAGREVMAASAARSIYSNGRLMTARERIMARIRAERSPSKEMPKPLRPELANMTGEAAIRQFIA